MLYSAFYLLLVNYIDQSDITPEECWKLLISACENTCKMAPHGQCVSNKIPLKQKVDWVQCADCEAWVHCLCAGLSKQELSGSRYLCCGSVNSDDSFR